MDVRGLLRDGELALEGRLVVASNVTLLGEATLAGQRRRCVYKPISGERPLWDFPDGSLAGREVAAFLVSEAAGWHVVPPTVLRADGPLGPGMCQLWIDQPDPDPETGPGSDRTDHVEVSAGAGPDSPPALVDVVSPGDVGAETLVILEAVDGDGAPVVLVHADHPGLRRLALFDAVVNNADRKGGHVLHGMSDGGSGSGAPVLGVDHGVTFHTEPKLRTVLWGWAGAALTPAERDELAGLRARVEGPLAAELGELLSAEEIAATVDRVEALLQDGTLPMPGGRMPVPWPVF